MQRAIQPAGRVASTGSAQRAVVASADRQRAAGPPVVERAPRSASRVALGFTAGLALASCGAPEPPRQDLVLARYSGGEVTRAEFDTHVQRQASGGRSFVEGADDWRRTVLEELAVTEIMARAALPSPALDRSIADATESILVAKTVERLGWNDVSVSEREARSYYQENPALFLEPEKLRLQHIFLPADERELSAEERDAVRQRMVELRRRIMDGADFAAMAREHSSSMDGPRGGWMVLERGARAVRSFTEAAWSLAENEVSEPIDTPTGFQLARLAARIPAVERPFQEVRQFAADEVLRIKRRRLEEAFLQERGPRHGFERRYEVLADRQARSDAVLFSVAGMDFTVRDLLATLDDAYLPHYYSGYLEHLPRILDLQALRRVLILEARADDLENSAEVREAVALATRDLKAGLEIERRLTEHGRAIPEDDLMELYEQNANRYEIPRRRSLSVIRLAREEGMSLRETLENGEQLVERLRAGADFEEMARQRSQHVSAGAGGRLPALTDEEIRTRVQAGPGGRQVIDGLVGGEVSNAFIGEVYDRQTHRFEPAGVYIVRLDDEAPARQAAFEEVREQVRSDWLRRSHGRRLSELKRDLLTEVEFEVVDEHLAELGN